MPMKSKEVEKLLIKNGWYFVRQRGSHRIFKHKDFEDSIPVPMHTKDMATGTLHSILKMAGLK